MHTNIVLDDSLVDEGQNLIYFGLRRAGQTERSTIDCCIAQVGIENQALLLHRNNDFERIAQVTTLNENFIEWS